ncbi:hypothetical protein AX016_0067 [Cellulophaga sp. RHA19]|uniref:hypothetical protein n=1 Tax=Cellulophaga sp. RHA19 TaxID=1798237 RepID=UPI000C2BDA1D|nr:hypothetical protein [Cellulophaga sp. RHA19]PKB41913.1 hypothetical protein AX016_0067 [Cellulophaga sp. RHA19]
MGSIIVKAKNLQKVVEENYITKVGNKLTKTAEEVSIYTTEGSINMYSNTSIDIKGEEGTTLGEYVGPPESSLTQHPDIEKVEFIDVKNNTVLNQSAINGIEGGDATQFLYGNKLKIRITFTEEPEKGVKEKIQIKLKGKSKNTAQKFTNIDKLKWSTNVENKIIETNPFTLALDWYNEDFEYYDSHKTKIKSDDLNSFFLEIAYNARIAFLPKKINHLKPIAYRRNYEEYLGLYKYEDLTAPHSKTKDLVDNYENKYISKNSEILTLVKTFSEFINQEDLKIEGEKGIKKRVETDAKKLWELAVKQVQRDELDDRSLYWARNKMQVHLKRHPLFEKDIDFEESLINSGSILDNIIISFEELSRNYTGVSFSGKSGKKLLITGFDTFVLDPTQGGNPLQSNPSGINALALHGKTIGDYYIQTFIAPVRYKDFDEFKDGKGIIEKFVTPFVTKVDMILTASQGGVFRFDIDRFPAKNRGGFADNMHWGKGSDDNKTYLKQLTIGGKEFYETTLPYKKIVPNVNKRSDTFWVYFNQTFEAAGKVYRNANIEGTRLIEDISDGAPENNCIINDLKELQSLQSIKGSGSNYLSNEIYYRVSKLRAELRPTLPTGHLHVPLTQYGRSFPDSRGNIVTIDINPKMGELIEKIREIITKI